MKTPDIPSPDDKCGKKIDHIAQRLGTALAPLGFKRKGRRLAAQAGAGDEGHWMIVQLQADSWNEGPRGRFFVNLALQFPVLTRLSARRPGMEWLAQRMDEVDEALGQVRQRLGPLQAALPPGHALARPAHSDALAIGRDTDLAALADAVVQATTEVGLPWLRRHASLRALADFEGSLLAVDVDVRVAAAVLLGDVARAQQILSDRRGRFEHVAPSFLKSVRAWFAEMGLDVSALPAPDDAPRVSAWEQQRQAAASAEAAALSRQAMALREVPAGAALSPERLARAWVAEHRAQGLQQPAPLTDLPSGRDVAALDGAAREAVLLALLQQRVAEQAQPAATGPGGPLASPADAFEVDESVRALLMALLPTLSSVSEGTVQATLHSMTLLVPRRQQDLVTASYPWGLAELVKWLAGPAGAPHRAALQPGIAAWLDAYRRFALASFEQVSVFLAAERAKPIEASNPLHDVLQRSREAEVELQAKHPPPSVDELRRRIDEYPEQQLAAPDRQAVATLRRELRRDAASGRLPVAWDGDDWGAAVQAAWQAAEPTLREALTPTLQHWLEGVPTRPTQAWLRSLDARIAALPPTLGERWRPWLLQRLAAFSTSAGRTEWATTGPRPGVGARLGEASEDLLLGLLWWAWRDSGVHADALADTLQAVSTGAWQRLPEVGARAPAVGGLVLRLLAGLGGAEAARIRLSLQQPGAPRQLIQAAERALKEPLARPR